MKDAFGNEIWNPKWRSVIYVTVVVSALFFVMRYHQGNKPEIAPTTLISPVPVAQEEKMNDGSVIVRDKGASFVMQLSTSNQPKVNLGNVTNSQTTVK